MAGWGLIYSPKMRTSRWKPRRLFWLAPNSPMSHNSYSVRGSHCRPLGRVHIGRWRHLSGAHHRTCPMPQQHSWNLSGVHRTQVVICPMLPAVLSDATLAATLAELQCRRYIRCSAMPLSDGLHALDAHLSLCVHRTQVLLSDAPMASLSDASVASCLTCFFVVFVSDLVRTCALNFCWSFGSSTLLQMSYLRCWSSKSNSHLSPSHLCNLLDYKTNTCKSISPSWSCWSSNTKVQTKWAKGPFSLHMLGLVVGLFTLVIVPHMLFLVARNVSMWDWVNIMRLLLEKFLLQKFLVLFFLLTMFCLNVS